jgi:hypothetical protein
MNIDRYRGSLLGLAVGDTLGTALELKAPGSFTPITDIVATGVPQPESCRGLRKPLPFIGSSLSG